MAKAKTVTITQGTAQIIQEEKQSKFYVLFLRCVSIVLMFTIILIPLGIILFKTAPEIKKTKVLKISSPRYSGGSTFGNWNTKVHRGQAQIDRFERSQHEWMELRTYNDETGFGQIHSASDHTYITSLDDCSCPDFEKRSRPCKHIYFLATKMGYTSVDFYDN